MKINKNFAISESGFAFNGSTGDTFLLNEVALFIIQKIQQGASKEEIINSIVDQFDVTLLTAEKDFLDFLNQLKMFEVIEE